MDLWLSLLFPKIVLPLFYHQCLLLSSQMCSPRASHWDAACWPAITLSLLKVPAHQTLTTHLLKHFARANRDTCRCSCFTSLEKQPKAQEVSGERTISSDERGVVGLEMLVLTVSVKAGPSLNLELLPSLHHPTTSCFCQARRQRSDMHQACTWFLHCFREKGVKHPWGKRQEERRSAAQMLTVEPFDATPTVQ